MLLRWKIFLWQEFVLIAAIGGRCVEISNIGVTHLKGVFVACMDAFLKEE